MRIKIKQYKQGTTEKSTDFKMYFIFLLLKICSRIYFTSKILLTCFYNVHILFSIKYSFVALHLKCNN